jgi:hypothetical protein
MNDVACHCNHVSSLLISVINFIALYYFDYLVISCSNHIVYTEITFT